MKKFLQNQIEKIKNTSKKLKEKMSRIEFTVPKTRNEKVGLVAFFGALGASAVLWPVPTLIVAGSLTVVSAAAAAIRMDAFRKDSPDATSFTPPSEADSQLSKGSSTVDFTTAAKNKGPEVNKQNAPKESPDAPQP